MRTILQLTVRGLGAGALLLASAGDVLGHAARAPEPSLIHALAWWSTDPLPWGGTVLAGIAYLVAVRKVNGARPRVRVPVWRVVAWLAGLAAILVALVSAIDLYADALLSVHMVQHLLLAMVAPPLLALGAPIVLLLRVATPGTRRRWILPVLHSRVVRLVASPFVAWPLFAVVMFASHFSPLYNAALEDPILHVAEHTLYLVGGMLFWWPLVAADPIPRRLGYPGRVAYVVLQMPLNAAVGLGIYFAPTVLYPHYGTIERTWGPTALTDQQIGGTIMWGVGDLLLLLVVPLLVAAWMRTQARWSQREDARRLAATYKT